MNNRWNQSDEVNMQDGMNQQGPVVLDNNTVARYIGGVFAWMFLALMITAGAAYLSIANEWIFLFLESFGRIGFFGIIIGKLFLVGFLSIRIHKMSFSTAVITFLSYAFLTGFVFSMLAYVYEASAIINAFGITAVTFGIMSVVGYTTKTDLTSFGKLLFMALIGIIIASILNFFLGSAMLDYVISYIGVAIFVGLIAYDVQKIKSYALVGDSAMREKLAIFGALSLYLDFVNLFLFLLRIFGGRKD